jgi:hypothetical protein
MCSGCWLQSDISMPAQVRAGESWRRLTVTSGQAISHIACRLNLIQGRFKLNRLVLLLSLLRGPLRCDALIRS